MKTSEVLVAVYCNNVQEHVRSTLVLVLLMSFLFSDSLKSDPDLPSLLLQFCQQVVDGLVCLAGKSFVHRDIAARNILLDKELNCKVRGGREEGECSEASVFT